MNEINYTEYIIKISQSLAEINTKLSTLCQKISEHEIRLNNLENNKNKNEDSFKNEMLKLLTKSLIISLTSIASLCGAGGLISQFLK